MNELTYSMEFIWFSIFIVLLIGYAILDGFDLGVGMLHLFSKEDRERRLMLNTIGPVWDGNEVWLVTSGGALFAGFPDIYATLCSAFYVPIMVLLSGLIFRAVAIEVRSKQASPVWRWTWDILFSLASLIIAFGLGLVLGNLVIGMPLNEQKEYIGTGWDLVNPFAISVGVLTVALFSMHGALFTLLKTEGELHEKIRKWINPCIIFFIMCYAITTVATLIYQPHMSANIQERPLFFVIAVINMFTIALIPREVNFGRDGVAFLASCLNIICLLGLFAVGMYPTVVRAVNDPANLSLTIYNSSSSPYTLKILFIIAIIGVPLVLAYTAAVYWIFHGKVKLEQNSY